MCVTINNWEANPARYTKKVDGVQRQLLAFADGK